MNEQLPQYVCMRPVSAARIVAIDYPPARSPRKMVVLTLGLPDGAIASERISLAFIANRNVELGGWFLRDERGIAEYRSAEDFARDYARLPDPKPVTLADLDADVIAIRVK